MPTFHLVSSLLIVFVSVNQIAAGDKEDVQAVIEAIYATANEYDIDANASFVIPGKTTLFSTKNHALDRPKFGEEPRKLLDEGFKWYIKHHTAEINVYGECAVAIGYEMSTWYPPDAPANTSTGRITRILNKVDGSWKIVHIHRSHGGFVQPESTESNMKTE